MSDVLPYGEEFDAAGFPHGLRCIDCDKQIGVGDRYATRLHAMTYFMDKPASVAEIICLECALGGSDERNI